jgi:hypothetical protein
MSQRSVKVRSVGAEEDDVSLLKKRANSASLTFSFHSGPHDWPMPTISVRTIF